LDLAKVILGLLKSVVATRARFLGARKKHNIKTLVVCKVSLTENSDFVVVVKAVQVTKSSFDFHHIDIRGARRVKIVIVLSCAFVIAQRDYT
jgi:hypothetical protein